MGAQATCLDLKQGFAQIFLDMGDLWRKPDQMRFHNTHKTACSHDRKM
jgi:hypothetical protein